MSRTSTTPVDASTNHAHVKEHHDEHEHDHALEWVDLVRIGLVALACIASWLNLWQYLAPFDVIALVATLVGGYPIFKEAVANLLARRMTMELSMTIALAAALAIGEFFTALVIVLFVLIAEVLEGLTVGRGGVLSKTCWTCFPATPLFDVRAARMKWKPPTFRLAMLCL